MREDFFFILVGISYRLVRDFNAVRGMGWDYRRIDVDVCEEVFWVCLETGFNWLGKVFDVYEEARFPFVERAFVIHHGMIFCPIMKWNSHSL